MIKTGILSFTTVLLGLVWAGAASGQTPANISIVQGNGQLICDGCPSGRFSTFDFLVVRVTDASNRPVPGATVTWTVTSSSTSGGAVQNATTNTGTDTRSTAAICSAVGQSCNAFLEGTPALQLHNIVPDTVTASIVNGNFVTFNLTQSPPTLQNDTLSTTATVSLTGDSVQPGTTLQGIAGSQYGSPIKLLFSTNFGGVVPNVSVRLIPDPTTPTGGPSISCVTGPGADPGSVLSDGSGVAVCTPVFGGAAGGPVPFRVLAGGTPFLLNPNDNGGVTGVPFGYNDFGPFSLVVTSPTVGGLTIVSGNNQSGNRGQALSAPLVAQVVDASGINPIAGQQVIWSVSPAGSAQISTAVSTSDSNGQVSTTVTLSTAAVGVIQIKATTSTGGFSATFTVTVNVQITGLTKVSGDNQTAVAGAAFAQPLVVQATTTAGQVAGIPVQFTISGSGSLSATTVSTTAAGQASVNVTAGAAAGTITVTANAGGVSPVTFTLTVIPPGPSISGASFLNGAGFFPSSGNNFTALSPCGIGTLVNGTPLTTLPTTPNMFAAPNQQDTGVKISFGAVAAPILSVTGSSSQQLITFQVPCELVPNSYTVTVTVNGGSKDVPFVPVRPAAPGIFDIPMSDGVRRAVLVRPDGTFVSLLNPARRSGGGEILRMYITGAGPVQPPLTTNSVPTPGVDSNPVDPTSIVVGVNNSGVRVLSARAAPNLIGVYEIVFQVPPDAPAGNNVVLAVGITTLGNPTQYGGPAGSRIPIQ